MLSPKYDSSHDLVVTSFTASWWGSQPGRAARATGNTGLVSQPEKPAGSSTPVLGKDGGGGKSLLLSQVSNGVATARVGVFSPPTPPRLLSCTGEVDAWAAKIGVGLY